MKNLWMAVFFLAVLGTGCRKRVPVHPPVTKAPVVSPVEGDWQSTGRSGNILHMVFKPGGQLEFQGGLGFYNPGLWTYDSDRQELTITLPHATDEKLQIFKLYVGDGVKAFDRQQKRITYDFNEQTTSLNIAGWNYIKASNSKVNIAPEPSLK